jgi:hypothetical protein
MNYKSILKTTLSIVSVLVIGLILTHCEDSTPTGVDEGKNQLVLKDSTDSANYFHSLYKGKWLLAKYVSITWWPGNEIEPARWDTLDYTNTIEYAQYLDSVLFRKAPNDTVHPIDSLNYKVTRDSICINSWYDNGLFWGCFSHAFKGNDTLDYSDSINTEIWVRAK